MIPEDALRFTIFLGRPFTEPDELRRVPNCLGPMEALALRLGRIGRQKDAEAGVDVKVARSSVSQFHAWWLWVEQHFAICSMNGESQ